MGIPGGRSLFTPIDMVISGNPYFISITPTLLQCLEDWRCLIQCMAKTPTSALQLIGAAPTHISSTDACRLEELVDYGAVVQNFWNLFCGKWNVHKISSTIWWQQKNQTEKITINDLELSGALLCFLALESKVLPLIYTHLAAFCDNITTVDWATKLRTSKYQISGYLLLFLGLPIHQDQESSMIWRI